jgi:hypothetical protein
LETISISAQPERLRSTKDHGRVLVVQRFAGVLLQMQALDADLMLPPSAGRSDPRPRRRSGCLYWLI